MARTASTKLATAAKKSGIDLGAPKQPKAENTASAAPSAGDTPGTGATGETASAGAEGGGEPPASVATGEGAPPAVVDGGKLEVVSGTGASVVALTDGKAPKGFKIEESDKDPQDIIREYVRFSEGGNALVIAQGLPLEEWLPLLDYLTGLHDKIGFLVGDALIYAHGTYGERLVHAMAKTGRSISTLKGYVTVATAIPPAHRVLGLSFKHHQAVTAIANSSEAGGIAKAKEVLALAWKDPKTGAKLKDPLNTSDFREVAKKYKPKPKTKAASKRTGPKTKSQKAAAAEKKRQAKSGPHKHTPAEMEALGNLFGALAVFKDAAITVNDLLGSIPEKANPDKALRLSLYEALCKGENSQKKSFNKDFPMRTIQALLKQADYIEAHTGTLG